jgi:hypothetical protein
MLLLLLLLLDVSWWLSAVAVQVLVTALRVQGGPLPRRALAAGLHFAKTLSQQQQICRLLLLPLPGASLWILQ